MWKLKEQGKTWREVKATAESSPLALQRGGLQLQKEIDSNVATG